MERSANVNNSSILSFSLQEVCYQYWPDTEIKRHGEYTVEVVNSSMSDGYVERVISVTDKV